MLGWIQLKRVRAAELLPPWVEGIRARYGSYHIRRSHIQTERVQNISRCEQEVFLRWFVRFAIDTEDVLIELLLLFRILLCCPVRHGAY